MNNISRTKYVTYICSYKFINDIKTRQNSYIPSLHLFPVFPNGQRHCGVPFRFSQVPSKPQSSGHRSLH